MLMASSCLSFKPCHLDRLPSNGNLGVFDSSLSFDSDAKSLWGLFYIEKYRQETRAAFVLQARPHLRYRRVATAYHTHSYFSLVAMLRNYIIIASTEKSKSTMK